MRLVRSVSVRYEEQVPGEPQVDPLFEDFFEFLPALLVGVGIEPDAFEPGDLRVPGAVFEYFVPRFTHGGFYVISHQHTPGLYSPVVTRKTAAAKRLDELRRNWLNPEGAGEAELKKRTLTNL